MMLKYHIKTRIFLEPTQYLNAGLSHEEIQTVINETVDPDSTSSFTLSAGLTTGSVDTWASGSDAIHYVAWYVHHELIHAAQKRGKNMMDKTDPTFDIIAAYVPLLIRNHPPDDELAKYLRAILVSRHRYLSIEETADCSQNWHGAHVDVTRYYVGANMIFEVDRELYNLWGSFDGVLRQAVPISDNHLERAYGIISATTQYQYLIGFQVGIEALISYEFRIGEKTAMKVIDVLLSRIPNEELQ